MTITPERIFNMNRREALRLLGLTAAASLLPGCARAEDDPAPRARAVTSEKTATTYNNFYEFGFTKRDPAQKSGQFATADWTVEVGGLVENPLRLTVPDMVERFGEVERVYRLRCVEGWLSLIHI